MEKTNKQMGISCNETEPGGIRCWVACECQSDWSTSAPSGEYVYATDKYYAGGLSSMSANGSLSSMSANGNLSTMSGNYSISTMGSNGGMTCYKKACKSGYYLDAPSTSYFKRTSSTGTLGLTCWKTTGCASGYSENATGTAHSYNDRTCKQCIYTCPSGYQSAKCSTGYYQSKTAAKYCIGDSSQTNGTCYECKQCSYSCSSGYTLGLTSSSCSSSQTFSSVDATSQKGCPKKTCGKCESSKPIYYKVRVILLPENAVMNTNGQYSVGFPDGSKYTSSSQFGSIALGLSCYNDVYSSGTTPLFDTVTIAGDISYINRNGTRTDDSFKYEMNCNWPRTSLDGGAGLNAIYPIIAPTADTDRVAVQYSNLELNIPGVGWEDDAASFEYNGKRYWIQFDVTVETGRVVVGQAGPSSQRYNCPGKGESDTSWPNCD